LYGAACFKIFQVTLNFDSLSFKCQYRNLNYIISNLTRADYITIFTLRKLPIVFSFFFLGNRNKKIKSDTPYISLCEKKAMATARKRFYNYYYRFNIKDIKSVLNKDAICFLKYRYLFCFFAMSFSVSYLFFKVWMRCVIDGLLSLRLQFHK